MTAADNGGDSGGRLTPRGLYRAVLLAAMLVGAGLVLDQLLSLVLLVLMTVIFAIALSAFARRLERYRIPRTPASILALLILLALFAGVVALLVPPFTSEVNHFVNSLPSLVDRVLKKVHAVTGAKPASLSHSVQHFVKGYTSHPSKLIGPLTSVGLGVAGAIGAVLIMILTALYMTINPEPLVTNLLRLFPPGRRGWARGVLERLRRAWVGWLRGLIVAMVIIGVLVYVGLRIVGLEFAIFFAVISALFEVIPYFGALASGIPAVLLGLTHSPGKALAVAAVFLVAHQVDGNVIGPIVMARAVKLHPAVVAIGVVVVERLFGLLGLVIAVPIISTFLILVDELWAKPMDAATGRTRPRALLRTEAPAFEEREPVGRG